jgi:hypothetical protein
MNPTVNFSFLFMLVLRSIPIGRRANVRSVNDVIAPCVYATPKI